MELALFQDWLVKAFRKFTSIDPSPPEGQSLLGQHFFSQSAPDTRRKLQKLPYGRQIPKSQLLGMAFGVFNNQDQAEEDKKTQRDTTGQATGSNGGGRCEQCPATSGLPNRDKETCPTLSMGRDLGMNDGSGRKHLTF